MRNTLLAGIAAATLMATAAVAQSTTTTTTTTWSPDEGQTLTQSWTTGGYAAPATTVAVPATGAVLPQTITAYPLPQTVTVPDRENYQYTVIDNRPVVIERTTRRVVHVWP